MRPNPREELQALLEETAAALLFLDPAGVVTGCDLTAARLLGYPVADLKGRDFDSLFTLWNTVHPTTESLFHSLDKSGARPHALAGMSANQNAFAANVSISPLTLGSGEGYVCRFINMDPMLLQLAGVNQGEIEFRRVFDQHPKPQAVLNRELKVVASNAAMKGLIHAQKGAVALDAHQRVQDWIPLLGVAPASLDALNPREVMVEPLVIPLPPDQVPDRALMVFPLQNSGGGNEGYLLSIEVLPEKKAHSGAADGSSEEALRTARVNSEFMGRVGHELRTPLNAIIGFIRLAEEQGGKLDKETGSHLADARQSALLLLEMVNNVVELARLEAGAPPLGRVALDPEDLMEEVVRTLAPQAFAKGLEIASFTALDVPARIQGAPVALRQVLLNLVTNAIRFTEKGSVWLRMDLETHTEGAERLRISVSDSGHGIPPEDHQRIFESFVQSRQGAAGYTGGVGLGLAIVRHLTQRMEGTIEVISQPDQGTTFTLRLPLLPAGDTPGEALDTGTLLQNVPALVLMREGPVRSLLLEILQSMELIPEAADSLEHALRRLGKMRLRDGVPTVVLMDHSFGIKALAGFARTLRRDSRGPQPLLIYLSPLGDTSGFDELLQGGVSAFCKKPVSRSTLRGTIQDLLGQPQQPSPGGNPELVSGARRARQILVADDNPVNQRLMRALLVKAGYRVSLAANGREAVMAAAAGGFDAVLMDLQMPVLDGFAAAREIRACPGGEVLPIIALTADNSEREHQRCLQAGMNAHLDKPVVPDTLFHLLDKLTFSGPSLQPDRAHSPPPGDTGFSPGFLEELERVLQERESGLRDPFFNSLAELLQERLRTLEALGHPPNLARLSIWAAALAETASGMGALRLSGQASRLAGVASGPEPQTALALLPDLRAELTQALRVLESIAHPN